MEYNRKHLLLIISILVFLLVMIIMVSSQKKEQLTDKNSVGVYFVKTYGEDSYKMHPVRRKIYKDENRLQIAISELLKGPSENEKRLGYFSEIPKETKLIAIKETPERATINLSKDFEHGGGSSSMELRIEQLINTALDAVDKKPVYLEIEGEEVKYIGGEGISVPQPLSKNMNKAQDI